MKKTNNFLFTLSFLIAGYLPLNAQEKNAITLQPENAKVTISKDIYGHFAEHLGRCVYEGIWVGENSSIPNTKGYRNDVVAALKDLSIPVLRWPGGCFADTYHWKDGIGPRDKRASIVNVNWGRTTEDNSFGTHEFLNLCEILGCDAYISGNVGSGTVQEMAEWAEYMTSDAESPMTKLRKQNGREKPWKVKYFGIGNEAWGCGGNMTPEHYSDMCKQYGTYINYAGRGVNKVASGASDFNYNWTDVVMKNAGSHIQGIGVHYYTLPGDWDKKGSSTEFTEKEWFTVMKKTSMMDSLVKTHLKVMDKYDKAKRVGLIVDEWGTWYDVEPGTNPGFLYQQNTMRDALVAAINLNIFNNHADRIKMTNIAQVINVLQSMILTDKEKMVLTPSYYVFRMYKVHQNATLIPVSVISRNYTLDKESIPAISVSASKDANGKIHVTLANLDPNAENPVTLDLGSIKAGNVTSEVLTSKAMNDYNDFGKAAKIIPAKFDKIKISGSTLQVIMPSKSVVSVEISTK
ncbi:MAG: alpha-L-arabinofuranosidase C-terminal domain-containing protein [Bacteroidota bacterium]|nr:alpha-L-arabinofuranosidase C-terminal domain-containing protein [Bacteroidota bacterium]